MPLTQHAALLPIATRTASRITRPKPEADLRFAGFQPRVEGIRG
ncbi:hypothetical protein [Sagittula sp. S175]